MNAPCVHPIDIDQSGQKSWGTVPLIWVFCTACCLLFHSAFLVSKIIQSIYPLQLISWKSLSGTVKSLAACPEQFTKPPNISRRPYHPHIPYKSGSTLPQGWKLWLFISTYLCCCLHLLIYLFAFQMFVNWHTLTGDILIVAKICRKCIWLTSRPVVMWKVCFFSWDSNLISWVKFFNT